MAATVPCSAVAVAFADAIAAVDLNRAVALLRDDVDFRAMTPNRIWEAAGPADVHDALRAWLADPDEQVEGVETTSPVVVEDTTRVGWRVRVTDADGPHVYEQQAYVREDGGRIAWMRVICSGHRRRAPPERSGSVRP